MTFEEYKEVLKNGEREEWYGELVPKVLLTARVRAIASMVEDSINKMESDLNEMHGNTKQKETKKFYINDRWRHIKTLPYHSNGLINDVYMVKYKQIMSEIEEEEKSKKTKTTKTRKPKSDITTKPVETTSKVEESQEPTPTVVKGRRSKNSKLIFGK